MADAQVRAAARRAAALPRSAIREIMSLAAQRPDVIHLEVGEPDASTPAHIVEGACEALRSGWTKYAPNAGLMPLRSKVADRYARRWGMPVSPDQVVITTGAIGGLFSALLTVLDPGDEVLIPDPGWPNYESIPHLAGAKAVRYAQPAENGFLPSLEEIRRLTGERTKAILINTPGNPTGAVFPKDLMRGIVEHARETGIYVVSDEIYEDIIYEGEHWSAALFGASDRVFVVSGASKSYAMTGWRLGWLICPPSLAGIAAGLQEPITSCASTVAQKAGETALESDQACVREFSETFQRRRDIVVELFGGAGLLPIVPGGAFYALVDISGTGMDSLSFCKDLLMAKSVAAVPGITFGPSCDGFIRIAFTASDENLRVGLDRIRSHREELLRRPEGHHGQDQR
jgi:aspartate aminotransferase/aminotransferase